MMCLTSVCVIWRLSRDVDIPAFPVAICHSIGTWKAICLWKWIHLMELLICVICVPPRWKKM
jgi:hypothetical protein